MLIGERSEPPSDKLVKFVLPRACLYVCFHSYLYMVYAWPDNQYHANACADALDLAQRKQNNHRNGK